MHFSKTQRSTISSKGWCAMEKDPVCGMEVDRESAAAQSEYQGRTYYFCAQACKEEFDRNPGQYLKESEVA